MRAIAINDGHTENFEDVESIESEGAGDLLIDELGGISPDILVLIPDE